MNKKILSIFVMIMALSLFGVSCSNEDSTGTGGNNSGNTGGSGTPTPTPNPNPTTITVTTDTLKKAAGALGGDSDSLLIKSDKTILNLASKTKVTVDANTITITITDDTLNTANDGSKSDTKTNIEKVLNGLKTEMKKQGVDITAADVGNATDEADINKAKAVSFTLYALKVADTETTKYVLPEAIKELKNVKIVIAIGSGTGSWS